MTIATASILDTVVFDDEGYMVDPNAWSQRLYSFAEFFPGKRSHLSGVPRKASASTRRGFSFFWFTN